MPNETIVKKSIGTKEIENGIMGAMIHYMMAIQIENKCGLIEAKEKGIVFLNKLILFIEDEIKEEKSERQDNASTENKPS